MADPKSFLIRAGKYNPTRETDRRRSIDRNAENAARRDSTGLLLSTEFLSRVKSSSTDLDKLSYKRSDEIIFPANTPPGTGKLKLTRPGSFSQRARRPHPALLANQIASTQLVGYRYHHDGEERHSASRGPLTQPWRAVIHNPRLLRTIETAMKKQSTANLKRHTYTINHLKTPVKDFIKSAASYSQGGASPTQRADFGPLHKAASRTLSSSNKDIAKLNRMKEESLRMQLQAREMAETVRRSLNFWKRRGSGESNRRLSIVEEEGTEAQTPATPSFTPMQGADSSSGMVMPPASFVTGVVTDERKAQLAAYRLLLERRKQDTDFAVEVFLKQGEVRQNAHRLTREGLGLPANADV